MHACAQALGSWHIPLLLAPNQARPGRRGSPNLRQGGRGGRRAQRGGCAEGAPNVYPGPLPPRPPDSPLEDGADACHLQQGRVERGQPGLRGLLCACAACGPALVCRCRPGAPLSHAPSRPSTSRRWTAWRGWEPGRPWLRVSRHLCGRGLRHGWMDVGCGCVSGLRPREAAAAAAPGGSNPPVRPPRGFAGFMPPSTTHKHVAGTAGPPGVRGRWPAIAEQLCFPPSRTPCCSQEAGTHLKEAEECERVPSRVWQPILWAD